MLVDTHVHLNVPPLAEDVDGVLDRARRAGVTRLIAVAYDLESWRDVAELAKKPGVFAAFGLHPWVAAEALDAGRLAEVCVREHAVAVGEIGLDYKIETFDRERQLAVLRLQLDVAVKLDLPAILHCRGAFEDMFAVLEEYAPKLQGVVHAFSRGAEMARRFVDLGMHVAFGGAITRVNANRALKAAAAVPDERLLLETDAPSIGLEGIPAEETEPRHTAETARALAAIRGISYESICELTTRNARRLFKLP